MVPVPPAGLRGRCGSCGKLSLIRVHHDMLRLEHFTGKLPAVGFGMDRKVIVDLPVQPDTNRLIRRTMLLAGMVAILLAIGAVVMVGMNYAKRSDEILARITQSLPTQGDHRTQAPAVLGVPVSKDQQVDGDVKRTLPPVVASIAAFLVDQIDALNIVRENCPLWDAPCLNLAHQRAMKRLDIYRAVAAAAQAEDVVTPYLDSRAAELALQRDIALGLIAQ